jgi:hypothetical protein
MINLLSYVDKSLIILGPDDSIFGLIGGSVNPISWISLIALGGAIIDFYMCSC